MRKEQGRPSGRGNSISKGPEIVNRGSFAVSMYAVVKTWNRRSSGAYGPYQGKPPWVLSLGFGLYSVCLGQLLKVFEQWHDSSSKSKAGFWRVAVGGGLLWQIKSWGRGRNSDILEGTETEQLQRPLCSSGHHNWVSSSFRLGISQIVSFLLPPSGCENLETLCILSARQTLLASHITLYAATPNTWDQLAVDPPTPDVS